MWMAEDTCVCLESKTNHGRHCREACRNYAASLCHLSDSYILTRHVSSCVEIKPYVLLSPVSSARQYNGASAIYRFL